MSIAPGGPYLRNLPTGYYELDTARTIGSSSAPRWTYVPPGGFQSLNAALALTKAKAGITTFWDLEASIGAGGTLVTDAINQTYPKLLRDRLFARYPWHGDTYLTSTNQLWNAGIVSSAWPWVMDVVPTVYNLGIAPAAPSFGGPFFAPMWSTAATMPLCHYVHPSAALKYNARALSYYYFDGGNQDGGASTAGRTHHVQLLDGSGDVLITAVGDNKIHRVDFVGLPNVAGNGLRIGNQGAASIAAIPIGVASYSASPIPSYGVHFCFFSFAGSATIADLMRTNGAYPSQRIARYMGPSNAAAPFTPDPQLSPPFMPDACIIGAFDDQTVVLPARAAASGTSPSFPVTGADPARAYHGIRQIVQVLRRNPKGCDIIFNKASMPNGITSDSQPGAIYQMQNAWHYWDPVFRLAVEKGYSWMDIDSRWGELGVLSKFQGVANPHPTPEGHIDIDHVLDSMGVG